MAASKAALKKGGCVVTAKGTTVNYTITTPYWTELTTKDNWHYNSPPLHHTSVRALKPQTRYYYQVSPAADSAPCLDKHRPRAAPLTARRARRSGALGSSATASSPSARPTRPAPRSLRGRARLSTRTSRTPRR